jgi:glycosyltransferase involved in cell wall biosynthesis
MIPYSPRIPVIRRKSIKLNGATIQPKHLSIKVALSALISIPKDMKRNKKYLTGSKIHRLRSLLDYSYTKKYAMQQLEEYQPSVVHIHGFLLELLPFYDAVMELGVPFVATAHGVYSFDESINLWFDRSLEKDLFLSIAEKGYPITVVSSRVKEEVIRGFAFPELSLHVVLNGVDIDKFKPDLPEEKVTLRIKYGIDARTKVLLTVASIQKRKNQMAVIEALGAMKPDERMNKLYLVVGAGDSSEIVEQVVSHHLELNVHIIGKVSDEVLQDYYHIADFFILTSTSEGFPLVFLEAMAAGLPIITYSDIEAVEEIYDKKAMMLASARTVESLVNAINEATAKGWDRKYIRQKAESWSWREVCEEYVEIYKIAVEKGMRR